MKKTAVVGSFIVDLTARTPHLPEPGETVVGTSFRMGPGGKGSNQAVAAKRAGCELAFSAKLGRDAFAQLALDAFRGDGLPTDYVFQTGAALISVDERTSQNEIVVIPGASATYTDEDLAALEGMLEGCEYLLLQLEINVDAVEKLVRMARRKGIRVILNTAPVQPIPDALYPMLYLVTPNEVEAKILTGVPCDSEAGCRAAARRFLDLGVENVILTLGGRGAYLTDGEAETWLRNYDVPLVDTTGAGDAFNGGLLAGLSQGMDLARAAAYGNIVANLSVTKPGTAPSMPTREEIEAFMAAREIRL